jgi:mRNA-degrading endonuclease RelE of RelBE toxin-antitoxin system
LENDRLRFAERVAADWSALTPEEQDAARVALERLDDDPIIGSPLFPPFRGIWSFRVGSLRILYRLSPEARAIFVLKMGRAEEQG